jgi:hypothetical protein
MENLQDSANLSEKYKKLLILKSQWIFIAKNIQKNTLFVSSEKQEKKLKKLCVNSGYNFRTPYIEEPIFRIFFDVVRNGTFSGETTICVDRDSSERMSVSYHDGNGDGLLGQVKGVSIAKNYSESFSSFGICPVVSLDDVLEGKKS